MDAITIGKKIKELEPAYKDVPDEQLGSKYLEKYGWINSPEDIKPNPTVQNNSSNNFGQNIGLAFKILSQGGPITQQFGNYNPSLYRGINQSMTNTGVDIGVPTGTGVNLPDGVWKILEAIKGGFNKGYGNSVLAQNTKTGEKLRFSHLSDVAAQLNQMLQGGSRIGATGATGNVTGPHLDLEYYNQQGKLADVLKSGYGRYLQ